MMLAQPPLASFTPARDAACVSAWSRLPGVLAFAAFAVALWGQVFHLAAVPHEICADHGELVEHSAAQSGAPDQTPLDPSLDADRHDHCPLAPGACHTVASPAFWVAAPHATALTAQAPRAVTARHWQAASILRIAPKTSPPGARDA